jgi:hypothetical protein
LRLGFRELLYFQVVGSLSEEGLHLSPVQKREVFRVFTMKSHRLPEGLPQHLGVQGEWFRGRGELRKTGAVPFCFDLSGVSLDLQYRYRLYRRPLALQRG